MARAHDAQPDQFESKTEHGKAAAELVLFFSMHNACKRSTQELTHSEECGCFSILKKREQSGKKLCVAALPEDFLPPFVLLF